MFGHSGYRDKMIKRLLFLSVKQNFYKNGWTKTDYFP